MSKCPNCNSTRFIDIPSTERCPDCGLRCDYHGNGANEVYKTYLAHKWAREEAEEEARTRAYMNSKYGEGNW